MNRKCSYLTVFLLCLFLGTVGAHRFYLGKVKSGVLMALTLGGFGIWYVIDLLIALFGGFKGKREDVSLSPLKN